MMYTFVNHEIIVEENIYKNLQNPYNYRKKDKYYLHIRISFIFHSNTLKFAN